MSGFCLDFSHGWFGFRWWLCCLAVEVEHVPCSLVPDSPWPCGLICCYLLFEDLSVWFCFSVVLFSQHVWSFLKLLFWEGMAPFSDCWEFLSLKFWVCALPHPLLPLLCWYPPSKWLNPPSPSPSSFRATCQIKQGGSSNNGVCPCSSRGWACFIDSSPWCFSLVWDSYFTLHPYLHCSPTRDCHFVCSTSCQVSR